MMMTPSMVDADLDNLRKRLAHVTGLWSQDNYKASVTFYTRILPRLMDVERSTIFIMDMGNQRICSMYGTGLKEMQIEPPMEGSIVGRTISTGKSMIVNDLTELGGFHHHTAEQTGFTCRNMICAPIIGTTDNRSLGAIQLLNRKGGGAFSHEDMEQLEEIAHFLSVSIESIVLNQEMLHIAGTLDREVGRLEQRSVRGKKVIAESPAMQEVLEMVGVVSSTPINVLLLGENGTGKDLIARLIHERGDRRDQPFVPVNCSCIPETLVESEFFGHEKGAFTGAENSRKGRFEESSGGTLFLDEVGEMAKAVQPKFLRAIEEQEGSRLGSSKTIEYDLRLISATNKDLADEVKKGNFREDLFFRLFSVEIVIPPLRNRKEDILPLSMYFLEQTNIRFGKNVSGFSAETLDLFERFNWPGNVRQLLREIERLVALTPDNEMISIRKCSKGLLDFHHQTMVEDDDSLPLSMRDQIEQLERDLIGKALHKTGGNKSKAARLLNLSRQGLVQKMKRYSM